MESDRQEHGLEGAAQYICLVTPGDRPRYDLEGVAQHICLVLKPQSQQQTADGRRVTPATLYVLYRHKYLQPL